MFDGKLLGGSHAISSFPVRPSTYLKHTYDILGTSPNTLLRCSDPIITAPVDRFHSLWVQLP